MAASQFVLQVSSFMCRMSFNINFPLKWQVMLFMQLHFLGNVDFSLSFGTKTKLKMTKILVLICDLQFLSKILNLPSLK